MSKHTPGPWAVERPILFSAPMVRAILDGRKTQTRRIVKGVDGNSWIRIKGGYGTHVVDEKALAACPYGVPGDRLWVRETFQVDTSNGDEDLLENTYYRADGVCCDQIPECPCADGTKWRPSIHMPRWASRITLEVTDVRVERLHDISEEDARAEGVDRSSDDDDPWGPNSARAAFMLLWESIHGPGSWRMDADLWVWVIEFKWVTP